MATFGWSYKHNFSGSKAPDINARAEKVSDVDRKRAAANAAATAAKLAKLEESQPKKKRYHPDQKIYVGRLSWDTDDEALGHYFAAFGELEDVKVIRDKKTNISRGYGFVTFSKIESAEQAKRWCMANHPILDRREIIVEGVEHRRARQQLLGQKLEKEEPESDEEQTLGEKPPWEQEDDVGTPNLKKFRKDTLYWKYRWSNKRTSEAFGPYSTQEMLAWVTAGFFKQNPCWVRQMSEKELHEAAKPPKGKKSKDLPNTLLSKGEAISRQYNENVTAYDESSDSSDDEISRKTEDKEQSSDFVPVEDIDFSLFP